jgi:hypothetical protein
MIPMLISKYPFGYLREKPEDVGDTNKTKVIL